MAFTHPACLVIILIFFASGKKMWLEDVETTQIWVSGGEVILRREGEEFSYRLANEPGEWIHGLPEGLVWADAQALFF